MVLVFWQEQIFLRLEVLQVEKNSIQLHALFDAIIDAIQTSAKDFARFTDNEGCIRIAYLPQSEFGRKLQTNFSKNARRCEIVAPISAGGNLADSPEQTATQIASYLREQTRIDCEQPDGKDSNSASNATVLSYQLMFDHAIFALVLVSVHGAVSLENKLVANDVSDTVKAWCKMGPKKNGHALLTFIAN